MAELETKSKTPGFASSAFRQRACCSLYPLIYHHHLTNLVKAPGNTKRENFSDPRSALRHNLLNMLPYTGISVCCFTASTYLLVKRTREVFPYSFSHKMNSYLEQLIHRDLKQVHLSVAATD